MQYLLLSLFASAILLSCNNGTPPAQPSETGTLAAPSDLLGSITRSDLQQAPFSEWFASEFEAYQVEPSALATTDFSKVEIIIFMGTWCSDSQREVPHLFKVLDQADFPKGEISMIAVDEDKEKPAEAIAKWGIEYVPTIIVVRSGKELGRIVEMPSVSLESDLQSIISK